MSRAFHSGSLLRASAGVLVADLDGGWDYDLAGSYGVNLFGYDFYKDCIDRGIDRVRNLGPVLGSYHPLIQENVTRLKEIRLDEVSFHMSGTEAIMQAVRLARFHTRRSHVSVSAAPITDGGRRSPAWETRDGPRHLHVEGHVPRLSAGARDETTSPACS